MKWLRLCFFSAVIIFSTIKFSFGENSLTNYNNAAHFQVTKDVINADVGPFTATIGGFGNSLNTKGGGFEPVVYRNKYIALENAEDRVVVKPSLLGQWDTLREGVLDGAMVHVYRINHGKFNLVREDVISNGGFHVSGWHRAMKKTEVISPRVTNFTFRWNHYSNPNAKYYFTVRAIDYHGNLSDHANVLSIGRAKKISNANVVNELIAYSPTKWLSDTTSPPSPTDLTGHSDGNGSLILNWKPVEAADLAGYVVYRSDYPPHQHKGYFFELTKTATSPKQHIKTGDMVVVSKKFYTASPKQQLSNRVWGEPKSKKIFSPGLLDFPSDEEREVSWKLRPHEVNTKVEDAGETYLKLHLATDNPVNVGMYNHAGTSQNWYEVLEAKPYTIEVWLRSEGEGKVTFKSRGYYGKPGHKIEPIVFKPGTMWKKFKAEFTPPQVMDKRGVGKMVLVFTGPGTFYVDNFRIYRSDADYLDYRPHEYSKLKSSGMSALRTHAFIKTGRRTYDMNQLTNSHGAISGTKKLNSLPQTLEMMRKAGVAPWLQIEPHMNPREWAGFIEYLAAPYEPMHDSSVSKPWAYKRFRQGQVKPWVHEFKKIYFELGNESWNRLFRPWTFTAMTDSATGKKYSPGQVYGMFQEYVISLFHRSPYWDKAQLEEKFVFVLGGWAGNDYGKKAASYSPSSKFLTIGAYNGGWDENEGPPNLSALSYFNVLAHVNQQAIPRADRHMGEVRLINTDRYDKLQIGTYEAGPGYALNGLNRTKLTKKQANEQEQVMKSLAAGTATLDSFLARSYFGYDLQNFFTFSAGVRWSSHAEWYDGGQAYPSWRLLSLFNNEAFGDMLRINTLSAPATDLKKYGRRKAAVKDAPLVAVYALNNADRYALFIVSRKIPDFPIKGDTGFTPVTVDLPFSQAQAVTLYKMVGDFRSDNIKGDEVNIEEVRLPAHLFGRKLVLDSKNGTDDRGLPPASTLLYVFEGVR